MLSFTSGTASSGSSGHFNMFTGSATNGKGGDFLLSIGSGDKFAGGDFVLTAGLSTAASHGTGGSVSLTTGEGEPTTVVP